MVKGDNCMSCVFRYHKNIFKKSLRLFDQEAEVSPDDQMQQFGRGPWVFLDEYCKAQAECPVYSKGSIGLSCHLSHSLSLPLLCRKLYLWGLRDKPYTPINVSILLAFLSQKFPLSSPLFCCFWYAVTLKCWILTINDCIFQFSIFQCIHVIDF